MTHTLLPSMMKMALISRGCKTFHHSIISDLDPYIKGCNYSLTSLAKKKKKFASLFFTFNLYFIYIFFIQGSGMKVDFF